MVRFEGSEAFREVVWVLIEELHPDGWHIGGRPFEGPKSLMETLGKSKAVYEAIDGKPTTRQEFSDALQSGREEAGPSTASLSSGGKAGEHGMGCA